MEIYNSEREKRKVEKQKTATEREKRKERERGEGEEGGYTALVFNDLEELDDVGVLQEFEDTDFSLHLCSIVGLMGAHNFNGHLWSW